MGEASRLYPRRMPAPKPPLTSVLDAEGELARRDPVLAGLIATSGPCVLGRRRFPSHFEALCRSIVYQQLAGKAAAAIWARFRALVPGALSAEAVLALDEVALRGVGLSGAKARSISDLAAHVADGRVHLRSTARMHDEQIVAELSQVWGIGVWTAQMFLMFQLGRLDVWPALDFGVRNGYARLYGLPEMPTAKELEPLGESYRPFRSIAAWYCWRAVDTLTL
jgi:3-methyladenine DNA glycosylase/8-oxoguanine DNA glycosylase